MANTYNVSEAHQNYSQPLMTHLINNLLHILAHFKFTV